MIEDKLDRSIKGILSFLRVDSSNGCIEIGHIHYSDLMKKTTLGTDSIFIALKYVFECLGYRRCEWKCDVANIRSIRSALRFGFEFNGVFPQAVVYKNRNRDTAWFSITDVQWTEVKANFINYLRADNFIDGKPIISLSALQGQQTLQRQALKIHLQGNNM